MSSVTFDRLIHILQNNSHIKDAISFLYKSNEIVQFDLLMTDLRALLQRQVHAGIDKISTNGKWANLPVTPEQQCKIYPLALKIILGKDIPQAGIAACFSQEVFETLQCSPALAINQILDFCFRGLCESNANHQHIFLNVIANEQIAVMDLLLGFGADVNATDNNGNTALMWAINTGNYAIADFLIKEGAVIDQINRNNQTALMFASSRNQIKIAELLLSHGAQIDASDVDGNSALIWAIDTGHNEFIKLLLDHNANLNHQNNLGRTALFVSASKGNIIATKKFLTLGANPGILNNSDFSTLLESQFVRYPKSDETKQLIKQYSKKNEISYYKQIKKLKLLTQAVGIAGFSVVQGKYILWEGSHSALNAHAMAKSTIKFAKHFPNLLSLESALILADNLKCAAHLYNYNIDQLVKRINDGLPTFIFTGYAQHSVTVGFQRGVYWISDRIRDLPTQSLLMYVYKNNLLNTALDTLLKQKNLEFKKYKKNQNNVIPIYLKLKPVNNHIQWQQLASAPVQKVGDCSWSSLSGAVKAYLFLEMLAQKEREKPQEYSQLLERKITPEEYETLQAALEQTWNNWVFFQQLEHLENYVNNHKDDMLLITKSIEALNNTLAEPDHYIHEDLQQKLATIKNTIQPNPLKRKMSDPVDYAAKRSHPNWHF